MASRLEAEINSNQGKGLMVVPLRVADKDIVERSKSKAKDFVPSAFRNIPFDRWLKLVVEVRSPDLR
jgi:CRISPR/Cas system-associated endonuclease/helicase Cas3